MYSWCIAHTHTHPNIAFSISFPCTRIKGGPVNFTLSFTITLDETGDFSELVHQSINATGFKYCNCTEITCNQSPGPKLSIFENHVFYSVIGSVVGIILLVVLVTFCYHCAMVRNWFLKRRNDTEK